MKSKISLLLALSMFSFLSFSLTVHAETYPELCSVLNRTLQQGDTGEDVKRLQVVLGQEGIAYLGATGYFGPQTKAAVGIFQSRAGIYAVGKVGPQTLSRMRALWCQGVGGTDYPPTTGGGVYVPPTSSEEITLTPLNSSGDIITLGWSSRNSVSCMLNNQQVQTSGSQQFRMFGESNFTLICTNYSGQTKQKTITVRPDQNLNTIGTLNISIYPTTAVVGSYATLSWTSTNTNSCLLTGGNYYSTQLQPTGSLQIYVPSTPVNYAITCGSANGPITKNISTSGAQTIPGTPTASIIPSSANINLGSGTNINWTSSNTTSCTVTSSTGVFNYQGTSGSQTVYPTTTTTYYINCFGQNGQSISAQTVVYVGGGSTCTTSSCAVNANISANYTSINSGQAVTLTWYSSGANYCSLSGGNINSSNQSTSGTYLVYPNTTTNYFITCTNNSGQSATSQVNIVVNGQNSNAPTVTLNTSTNSVSSGQPVTLTWSSTNATSCTLNGPGINITQGVSGSYTVYPTTTSTYYVNCTNYSTGLSGTSNQVSIGVTSGGTNPTVSISASPNPVSSGQQSTISWSSTNASYCNITGTNLALYNQSVSGSSTVYPTSSTVYTATCYNSYGQSNSSNITLNIGNTNSSVTVTLISNPSSVAVNGSSVLTWSSTNASYCTLSGGSYSNYQLATNGSITVVPGSTAKTYSVTCTNGTYSASDSETVSITTNSTPSFTVTPTTQNINSGQSVVITLNKRNISQCVVSGGRYVGFVINGDTITVTPSSTTTTYTFTCTGTNGTEIKRTSVIKKVTTSLTGSVKVAPSSAIVNPNQPIVLTLTKTNINNCSVSGTNLSETYISTDNTYSVTPTGNSQYVFKCTGINNRTYYATSTLSTFLTSVSVTPATSTIVSGNNITLTLTKNNIVSCKVNGGTYSNFSVGNSINVAPTTTTTYTFSCVGTDNSIQTTSSTITVGNGTGPGLSVSPESSTIAYGGSQTIAILKTNINYCYLTGPGYNNSIYNDNSLTVSNATSSKTYTLNCYGTNGDLVSKTIQVNISTTSVPPQISITPSVATVTAPVSTPVNFNLSKTNINYCYVSGNTAGSTMNNTYVNANPFPITPAPALTTTYTFTCTGNNGSTVSTTTRIIVQ